MAEPRKHVPVDIEGESAGSSLMDKYRSHYRGIKRNPIPVERLALFAPIWYMITICMGVYHLIQNIFPVLYEGYSNLIFIQQCIMYTVFFEMMVNWLCVRHTDTGYPEGQTDGEYTTGRRFNIDPGPAEMKGESDFLVKVHLSTEDQKNYGLFSYWSWKPCIICQVQKPPRTHHCPICNKCILKRDHHCFFTNSCIGLRNQRFFVVFNIWAAFGTSYGVLHIIYYVLAYRLPYLSYLDLFYPFAAIRCLFGYISFYDSLIIFLVYSVSWFVPTSTNFFLEQVKQIGPGLTSFELDNGVKVVNMNTLSDNIRGVFGDYWLLNFIIPCHLWFPCQDDGKNWRNIKV